MARRLFIAREKICEIPLVFRAAVDTMNTAHDASGREIETKRNPQMTATAPKILDATGDDAATILSWSDRNPATIVKRTAKTIVVQEDNTAHMSGPDHDAYAHGRGQVVVFTRNYDAPMVTYTLRKNGRWVKAGESMRGGRPLAIGHRSYYRDPSF